MAGRVVLYAYKILASSGSGSNSIPLNSGSAFIPFVPWHISVFAFGYEISYGHDGISITEQNLLVETPDETVNMGTTLRTRGQFLKFIEDLRRNWTAGDYNALTHNCTMFVEEILHFLQIQATIPDRFTEVQGHARRGATYTGFGFLAWLLGKILPASGRSVSASL